jgi:hypothetical protein
MGDPSVSTGIAAYAPERGKEEMVRMVDETMTATGFERIEGFTAGYLIDGRVMSYADYERASCKVETNEDRDRCIATFNDRAVEQNTDEVRTGDEVKIAFGLTGGHAGIDATIASRKRGSTVCIEFTAFPATEFDPVTGAGIDRLRRAMIDTFGEKNVANVSCYRLGNNAPYWRG